MERRRKGRPVNFSEKNNKETAMRRIVGVIGAGSIGPDLAYGFASNGFKVVLEDISQDALDAAKKRIGGYLAKGVKKGKLAEEKAAKIGDRLVYTLKIGDLADCEYVIEAATEDLPIKQAILADLEEVVSADCLIGFATSGIVRSKIVAKAQHPDRCMAQRKTTGCLPWCGRWERCLSLRQMWPASQRMTSS
jgi:enoyl-CoA hydratase/3-hydroxyacyl-CoA dehydrogenase